uniref:Uncharacterized protein n=1 Tax=Theropithecus gelada TaxID=9565 RepID=A0A8D2K4B3_THEGE
EVLADLDGDQRKVLRDIPASNVFLFIYFLRRGLTLLPRLKCSGLSSADCCLSRPVSWDHRHHRLRAPGHLQVIDSI